MIAQTYAEKCIYAHNQERSSQSASFQFVGENIATGTGPADYVKFVNLWYDEVKDYTFETNSCKDNAVCGHYTQVCIVHQ